MTKKLIGRKATWYRPYCLDTTKGEYTVRNIVFYANGEILYAIHQGWIEEEKINETHFDCKTRLGDVQLIRIDEPARKLKENLNLKENYYIPHTNNYNEKECSLFIYVDGKEITVEQTKEVSCIETSLDINEYQARYTEYKITGITDEPITTVFHIYSKSYLNDLGKKAQALVEKHKDNYELRDLDIYKWARILKQYDLVEKAGE